MINLQCEWCGRKAVYFADYKEFYEPLCEQCWEYVKMKFDEYKLKERMQDKVFKGMKS